MGYLEGKVAVVTGASRGIGRAVALCFAREGARVAVNYHQAQKDAEEVVEQIRQSGGEALAIQADVSVKSDVQKMIEQVVTKWETVDILMNNAGVALDSPAESMREEEWDRVIDVSLKGTFLCTQAVIPHMRRQGSGKIINVSAASALRGRKNGVNFCAAKAGVLSLTKCFAHELAPQIQVNCLFPGFTETDEVIYRFGLDDPVVKAKLLQEIPLGRLATTDEIAAGALILASKYSDVMTGQSLMINGGSYM